ncbi:MAG: Coenzyme F420 hydrogenase/dehydrogenase, beta subunit C-terminal domain [Proteobacteria bacterium]|nr:Coenzyme F420 hydrogenase/dehydrogenase, beta subunit C-terminal domain [Pseudomonadota bacterium]
MRKTERKADSSAEEKVQGGQRELEEMVLRTGFCAGCGACVNLCPYQASYRDRTVILHHCDLAQGRCFAFCPRTPADLADMKSRFYDEADLTHELGAVKGFFIARAAQEGNRRRSQHGGVVTALMTLALRGGLIDAAVLTERGEDLLPRAVTVSEPEAAAQLGGSRFVVSPTVAEFNRALRTDCRRIGVVATPCQALALAKMRLQPLAAAESGMDRLKLVVGLFCGWALSWRPLTDILKKKTDLAAVIGMDIPPSRYHTLEVYMPEETARFSLDEITPCVRESCRSCADMTAEFSDLSVGSARLPEGWKAARLWNQVIVRTKRGRDLLELARRRGILEFREVPAGNLEKLKAASLNKKKAASRPPGESGAGREDLDVHG